MGTKRCTKILLTGFLMSMLVFLPSYVLAGQQDRGIIVLGEGAAYSSSTERTIPSEVSDRYYCEAARRASRITGGFIYLLSDSVYKSDFQGAKTKADADASKIKGKRYEIGAEIGGIIALATAGRAVYFWPAKPSTRLSNAEKPCFSYKDNRHNDLRFDCREGDKNWVIEVPDTTKGVGRYTNLLIDPSTGAYHIIYNDGNPTSGKILHVWREP